jgi:hypothetical protein
MGGSQPDKVALALAQRKNIDAADVIALLGEIYSAGIGAREEAEALIAFDRSLAEVTAKWRQFFADTIADHIVHRREPQGSLDQEKAEWLTAALAPQGRIATAAGFDAVVRAIEIANEAPASLSAFALQQINEAVIAGEGPAIGRRAHFSRVIDAEDVVLIARILHAAGGETGHPVSRAEAEALFDLHDATAASTNDPAFDDLFFKAIADHLAAAAGHTVVPRAELLAPDPRMAERRSVFGRARADEEPGFRLPAGSISSTALGPEEAAWLSSRVMRDGQPTAAEYALLRLFAQDTRDSDPSLRRFLNHAA